LLSPSAATRAALISSRKAESIITTRIIFTSLNSWGGPSLSLEQSPQIEEFIEPIEL
jgi:hypothetical protein